MKIFKRGSMIQEHRQYQASQRGKQETVGRANTNFEFLLDLMREH
jgi:hypothetical protein